MNRKQFARSTRTAFALGFERGIYAHEDVNQMPNLDLKDWPVESVDAYLKGFRSAWKLR